MSPAATTRCQTRRSLDVWSDASDQDERTLLELHLPACRPDALRCARPGRDLDLPARAEAPCRQRKRDRLAIRVEQQEERVVEDVLSIRRALGDLLAVQEHAQRVCVVALPLLLR